MRDEFDRWLDEGDVVAVRRLPSPGIAAVSFGCWAILVPGLFLHALCVWRAYRVAELGEA